MCRPHRTISMNFKKKRLVLENIIFISNIFICARFNFILIFYFILYISIMDVLNLPKLFFVDGKRKSTLEQNFNGKRKKGL